MRKQEAMAILNHLPMKQYRREKRYYHCPECNMWHLTSNEAGILKHDFIHLDKFQQYAITTGDQAEGQD